MQPVTAKRSPASGGQRHGRKARVLVADDHPVICDGLRTLIEQEPDLEFVGRAGDGEEAVRLAQKLRPDVAVMDLVMPQLDGLMATERLRAVCPDIAVLVLTGHPGGNRLASALRVGALGYVLNMAAHDEILQAIGCVASGKVYLDRSMAEEAFRAQPAAGPPAGALAGRDVEVLKLSAWGYGNKEIADRLDMTVKAVESCKTRCMAAFGLKSRHDLVQYAVDQGWLAPDGAAFPAQPGSGSQVSA